MVSSPGLEAPHPLERLENPTNLPIYRPQGLSYRFPAGWDIKIHVADGSWSAEKDSRFFTSPTESGLYAMVCESERQQSRRNR